MIDSDTQRSKDYRRNGQHEGEVNRPQICLVLQEVLQAEHDGRNQEDKKRRIDIERFRKQMNRSLNGVRQRTATTRTRSKDGKDSTAACDVHRAKDGSVADTSGDRQFERFFGSLREEPCNENGRNSEDRCHLRRKREREQSGGETNRSPAEIRTGADHKTPEIRRSSKTVTLRAEQCLLRRSNAQYPDHGSDT